MSHVEVMQRSQRFPFLYAGGLLLCGMILVLLVAPSQDTVPQVLIDTFARLEYVEQRLRRVEKELAQCGCSKKRQSRVHLPLEARAAVAEDGPVQVDLSDPILPWDEKRALEYKGGSCERKDLLSAEKRPFSLCLDVSDLKHDLISRTGRLSDCDGALRLARGGPQMPQELFLEVGSSTGMCTMQLLSLGWKVVAFEPSPLNLFFLSKSLLLNRELRHNLTLYTVALGDEAGVTSLYTGEICCFFLHSFLLTVSKKTRAVQLGQFDVGTSHARRRESASARARGGAGRRVVARRELASSSGGGDEVGRSGI